MKAQLLKKTLLPIIAVSMMTLSHSHDVHAASNPTETAVVSEQKANATKADANKLDTSKTDASKTDTNKADASKADTSMTDASKTDTIETDSKKPDDAKILEVAKRVIKGEYGSGEARKEKLKEDGFDAKVVQKKVNELIYSKASSNSSARSNASNVSYSSGGNAKRELRKKIESGGNYNTFTGNGYLGAYQFAPSTWNGLCAQTGTDPSDFSPAHQDQMADLYAQQRYGGWANTPSRGGW